jgi:hypothetical protein
MHRPVLVVHSSFIEWSHMTKNTPSGYVGGFQPLTFIIRLYGMTLEEMALEQMTLEQIALEQIAL